jgi:NAD-dependent deacetylase
VARKVSGAETLAGLIARSERTVVLTGAGISVPSGIPDFRSPDTGLWAHVDPMEIAHIETWRSDPVRFWGFYAERFTTLDGTLPNPAHHALAGMERLGQIDAVITQNIDGLHREAGQQTLVEVHGTIATSSCLVCGAAEPLDRVRAQITAAADGVPRCHRCDAVLKPDVVLFGEMLPAEAIDRAYSLAAQADLIVCAGTSLEVHPVAGLPDVCARAGGQVALVTAGPTPWDDRCAVKLDGDIAEELPALAALVGAL